MSSFQTAIQIIAALDDNAWGVLLPKLLAERTDAEKTENVTIEIIELCRRVNSQQLGKGSQG
ncbi:F-box domain-containing protein [Colletotrichum graminicola M1.001]|uniref:F-box domain-containing protein n=1 Tax=Colletotrichum graminicola (strain M1.001 / M2 / FGSC 10212) TaxID=645133 RepID=E3QEB6_COLGM|nr:F-box domain-containing protein [Colletotrichum graminicola M1.001]EFQ29222.1 F-box domain-containing protein [Colletotrichum graminicola M1.001]